MVEMLAMWLTGPEEKRNKQFLQRALECTTHSSTSVVTRHIR